MAFIFITEQAENKKCGGCNWETSAFYGVGNSVDEAKAPYDKSEEYGQGLCPQCLVETLVQYSIPVKKRK